MNLLDMCLSWAQLSWVDSWAQKLQHSAYGLLKLPVVASLVFPFTWCYLSGSSCLRDIERSISSTLLLYYGYIITMWSKPHYKFLFYYLCFSHRYADIILPNLVLPLEVNKSGQIQMGKCTCITLEILTGSNCHCQFFFVCQTLTKTIRVPIKTW